MNRLAGVLGAALLLATAATPARAQEPDSYVLRPGLARVSAGLRYSHFDGRFADGGTAALGDAFLAPLTAETFSPLATLQGQINSFLAAGGSAVRATPANLGFGTPDLEVALDSRSFPFRVEVGVIPGLEVGVQLPLVRSETRLPRFGLAGGSVGLNPDTAGNAAALGALGEEFRALGAARVLPVEGSALGEALQAQVAARGGEELELPEDTATAADFGALLAPELGVAPLGSTISPYRLGDLELDATYRLLSTFGAAPFPTDPDGIHYRVAVTAGVRLPTGVREDTARLFSALPEAGIGGYRAGAVADLFAGRIWGTASFAFQGYTGGDVLRLVAPPATPLLAPGPARTVSFTPGAELSLRVAPRFRITENIAAGAQYELLSVGEATYEGEGTGVLPVAGGTAQRLGAQIRYTTLQNWLGGAGLLPAEVVLGFDTALSGPPGMPDATTIRVQASLFRRFWGR